jgi:C-terminal processing protease CtpA/Prc
MSLGFEYEFRSGACEVTRVLPDGPARAAGLRAGDRIVEVRSVLSLRADDRISPAARPHVSHSLWVQVDDMPTAGGQDVLAVLSGEPGSSVRREPVCGNDTSCCCESMALFATAAHRR